MEFNTDGRVSDGVSMGTEGMRASLVSREVIADSIELVARGHHFDGLVCLVGCDKTIPGCRDGALPPGYPRTRALQRFDRAGPLARSRRHDPGRVRRRWSRHAAGKLSPEDLHDLESVACPGAGACGGQFTANTMATVLDVLGLSADRPQRDPRDRPREGRSGARTPERWPLRLVNEDVRPRSIVTRTSIENAIVSVAATGGSTNGVLHLLAIAREAGVDLTIDEFDEISERTPIVASLKPGGEYVATDLHDAGGVPLDRAGARARTA